MISDRAWIACCRCMPLNILLHLRCASKHLNGFVKMALPKTLRIRIPRDILNISTPIEIHYQLQKLSNVFNRPFIVFHSIRISPERRMLHGNLFKMYSGLGLLGFIAKTSQIELDLHIVSVHCNGPNPKLCTIEEAFVGSEKCTALNFCSRFFDIDFLPESAVRILEYHPNITKLSLVYCEITDCTSLGKALSCMVNLTSLEIQFPGVPGNNIRDLLSAIRTTKLTELKLNHNKFDDPTILIPVLEKNLGITSLDISKNCLQSIEPLMAVLSCMSKLTSLDLEKNDGIDALKTTEQIKKALPWLAALKDWEDNDIQWSGPTPLGHFSL